MIYDALPIPTTDDKHVWGVYAMYRKTGLPPHFQIACKTKERAKHVAKELHDDHRLYPQYLYTWQWTVVDDWINAWWKGKDEYARRCGIRYCYREGGRIVITNYGSIE